MPPLPRALLKSFFQKDDTPTEAQFAAWIDSGLNLVEDRALLGLKLYNSTLIYAIDDTVIFNGFIYRAKVTTTPGIFDGTKWEKITFNALNLVGTWDALDNIPTLQTGLGNKGDYYIVSKSGSTVLNAVTSWQRLDIAVFNGTAWEKVAAAATQALVVSYDNEVSGLNGTDVQDAIDELAAHVDALDTDFGTLESTKADKVTTTVYGRFPGLTLNGDLIDSGLHPTDFLDKTNVVEYSPTLDYHPATKLYVDSTSTQKIIPGLAGNFAALTADGNLADSGRRPGDYLAKDNVTPYEPTSDYNPVTKLFMDTCMAEKTDLAVPALAGSYAALNAQGNLVDSLTSPTDFLSRTNTTVYNPSTAYHPATVKFVLDTVSDPTNITPDSDHNFVTNAQIAIWDAKQDALGFTAVPDSRTVNGHDLTSDVTVTKSDVGLDQVDNTADVDKPLSNDAIAANEVVLAAAESYAADPNNIVQDAAHRFISDTQLATLSTAVQNTLTVNGHALNSNISVTKSDVGLGNVTNFDTTNPANITTDATHRFITDTQLATLSTAVQNTLTVNGHALNSNISVTKSDVGLGNVTNFDTTNPANITTDATHRFITDTQLATLSTAVQNTRTVNGHLLNADVVVTKTDLSLNNVTNDEQMSLKFYLSDETTAFTNDTTSFTTDPAFPLRYCKLNFTVLIAGDYLIEWYYELGSSSSNGRVEGRILLDDVTPDIGIHSELMGISDSPPSNPGYVSVNGFYKKTGLTAADHSIRIQIRKQTSSGPTLMKRVRVKLTLVHRT
jgi:ribosomal protein S13